MFVPVLLVLLGVLVAVATAQNTFVGAVAEHEVYMGSDSDTYETKLQKNLDLYTGLIAMAKSQGVQVLVFPEFGLVPAEQSNRESLYPYAEKIGDVQNNNVSAASTPCTDASFDDKPILRQMSCAAQKYSIAVLVNMVDWVDCDTETDAQCPEDKHYQYNTNVVFDESGRLVIKYHKSHEFPTLLKAYDVVPEPSQVIYQSTFGVSFGIFTCFDIMFPDPAVKMRKQGITHFLYPVQQGELGENTLISHWSKSQQAILLSANLGAGEKPGSGDCSGILMNGEDLPSQKMHLHEFDKHFLYSSDNLLIAQVPF